jgi:GcrA cell cycle regulator
MEWNASDVALLRALWTKGRSAGQIATRLGHGRNAVCGKLQRMGLKRGHKPPTAKPKIVSVPKHRPAGAPVAASPAPVTLLARSMRKPTRAGLAAGEFTKEQLYAMLAEAIANTSRLPR